MTTPTFWQTLPRPLFGLAPMNGITDHPFRHIQKKYGNPPLLYTEFTGVERVTIGDRDLLRDFLYDESQRPIIGQIYGHQPALFRRMAVMLCELGFDGIDINMGCPTRAVADRGSGAGLILTPLLAQEIIRETKAGVADWHNGASVRNDPGVPRRFVEEVETRHRALPVAARAQLPVKAGLWEFSSTMSGAPRGSGTHTGKACITADAMAAAPEQALMEAAGRQSGGDRTPPKCEFRGIQREGARSTWQATCEGPRGKMQGTGAGQLSAEAADLQQRFSVKAPVGTITLKQTVSARRVGSC